MQQKASGSREKKTYTSTGVRPPWVTEQQTAPARANREYKATPESWAGSAALTFWTMASTLAEPVDFASVAIVTDGYELLQARLKRTGTEWSWGGRENKSRGVDVEWVGIRRIAEGEEEREKSLRGYEVFSAVSRRSGQLAKGREKKNCCSFGNSRVFPLDVAAHSALAQAPPSATLLFLILTLDCWRRLGQPDEKRSVWRLAW